MSQRNPQNDRYMGEKKLGQTRKSAAKAKPKTKAASSVRVASATPSKQDKKARKKAEKAKDNELRRESYHPPTPEYKRMRKIWFGLLGLGVTALLVSVFINFNFPEHQTAGFIAMGAAYVTVIGAFIFDGLKLNKLRKAYRAQLANDKSKENREREKLRKAAEREEKKAAEEAATKKADEPEEPASGLKGMFKKVLGKPQANSKSAADDTEKTSDSDTTEEPKAQKGKK